MRLCSAYFRDDVVIIKYSNKYSFKKIYELFIHPCISYVFYILWSIIYHICCLKIDH